MFFRTFNELSLGSEEPLDIFIFKNRNKIRHISIKCSLPLSSCTPPSSNIRRGEEHESVIGEEVVTKYITLAAFKCYIWIRNVNSCPTQELHSTQIQTLDQTSLPAIVSRVLDIWSQFLGHFPYLPPLSICRHQYDKYSDRTNIEPSPRKYHRDESSKFCTFSLYFQNRTFPSSELVTKMSTRNEISETQQQEQEKGVTVRKWIDCGTEQNIVLKSSWRQRERERTSLAWNVTHDH